MDESDVWALGADGLLTSLSASYRLVAATGSLTGDAFEVGLLVYKNAAGNYICGGPFAAADGNAGAPGITFAGDLDTGIFRVGANAVAITTGGADRLRVTTSGVAVMAGGANPFGQLSVGSGTAASGWNVGTISSPVRGNFAYQTDGSGWRYEFGKWQSSAFVPQLVMMDNGVVRPGADNSQSLGNGPFRWSQLHAGSGTIATCDIRFKTFRADRAPTDAEHAAALECFDAFGFYQFNDAIEAKGPDGARWHYGPAAQEVWAIWASHGLTDALGEDGRPVEGCVPPAFLCFDPIEEETAPAMEGWRPSAILGEDGEPVMVRCVGDEEPTEMRPTGDMVVIREAGDIFGVRIDQLHSLMLAALNRERKAMALTIAALEGAA